MDQLNNERLECWFWAGWEPLRHYQRSGKSGSPFFGKGAWLREWDQRKFSNDLIAQAEDLGATILITEFFKGFGRALESENWPRLQDFVARCHQRGLKVWGYAQTRSLYFETLATEVPDWASWVAQTYEGRRQTFGKTYFRCAPCLAGSAYADYTASVIADGVSAIGFDGVHLDNSYYEHCWCPRCAEKFRQWLSDRGDFEDVVGIPLTQHIQPPPLPLKGTVGLDPLQILWIQFGVNVRINFFATLRQHLQTEHPALTVAGNPAFPRADTAMISRCVDPTREAEAFDFLCCENGNLPRVEEGWISSQTEAHLMAEAGGYKIWATAWRETESGVSPPTPPGGIWAGLAEEFTFGNMLGNNWAFRPAGEGNRLYFEEAPFMAETFREAQAFFRQLVAEIRLGTRKSSSDVGIYHDPLSATLGGDPEVRLNLALHQYLLTNGIPFQIVLPGQEIPPSIRCLIVFHQGALPDGALEKLHSFARLPDHCVWLAGHSAQNDEWFVPRDRQDLRKLRSSPGVFHTAAFGDLWQKAYLHPLANASGAGSGHFAKKSLHLSEEDAQPFNEFFQKLPFEETVKFHRPPHVLVHSQRTSDGRLLFHFRDQAGSGALMEDVVISPRAGFPPVSSWQIFSPLVQPSSLTPSMTEGSENILLPPFQHYALVVAQV